MKILPKGPMGRRSRANPGPCDSKTSPHSSTIPWLLLGHTGEPENHSEEAFLCVWHHRGCISPQASDRVAGLHARAFYPSFHAILSPETKWPNLNCNSAK